MRLIRTSTTTSAGDIFALIRERRDITRTEIGRLTGLSRTAVSARLASLAARGLVVEREQAPSTGGRPAAFLSFNADAGIVLSVAIGRGRTRLAVCNLAGEILAATDIDQEPGLGPDDLMPDVVKRLDALLYDSGRRDDRIYGVGLSLPGTVDQRHGGSLNSPIMSGWDGVPLPPYFAELTNAPVILDNDANVIALAERRGDRAAFDDLLVIKASTGLGAGIIAGGVLQRGAVQAAGEFGHNKTPAAEGVPCRCGDTGCLEAIAGGWALVRALQEEGRSVGHLRDVVELANSGDAEARRLIRDSGRHVGEVPGRCGEPAQPCCPGGRRRYGRSLRHLRRGSARDFVRQRNRAGDPSAAGRAVDLWGPLRCHRERHDGAGPCAEPERHRRAASKLKPLR